MTSYASEKDFLQAQIEIAQAALEHFSSNREAFWGAWITDLGGECDYINGCCDRIITAIEADKQAFTKKLEGAEDAEL